MQQVIPERSGWRDQEISLRHRGWGPDLCMTDCDGIEFFHGRPVAFVEFKKQFPFVVQMNSRYQAVRWVASKCELPYYVLFYSSRKEFYAVQPLNQYAALFWAGRTLMSERDYVDGLYRLRGLKMPADIAVTLSMEEPDKRLWPRIESGLKETVS